MTLQHIELERGSPSDIRYNPVRYVVSMRSGLVRPCTSLREAIRHATAERRDGWPAWIRGLTPDASARVPAHYREAARFGRGGALRDPEVITD